MPHAHASFPPSTRPSTPSEKPSTPAIEVLETRIAPAAALFDLGTINGTNGFKINGVAANDGAGFSVSAAGDVNGDTFADFIVGAPGVDRGTAASVGASYVVFGKATAFSAGFDLSTLNGTNGFKLTGEAAFAASGYSVSAAGDVDGDGFDDLLIGAYSEGFTTTLGPGAAYVVYGKASGFTANVDLSSTTATKISGEAGGSRFGISVSAAGDVNDDGRADLIIGAPSQGAAGAVTGASYVIFGKTGGLGATLALSSLDGATGFKITGEADGDYAGRSVSGAGDINGDGFDDLIIGAYGADPGGNDEAGAAYVIFGQASGFTATLALSALTGTNGFKLVGEAAGDYAGRAVSGAGDVNGDGFDDVLIGAKEKSRTGLSLAGAAYVVFGKGTAFSASLNLAALNGATGFKIYGQEAQAELGRSVGAAGDVNGDGLADIVVGAERAAPNTESRAGSSYVIFGKNTAFSATPLDPSTLDGTNGFRIDGELANDGAGVSVTAAGDLNGDGLGDVLVGAFGADPAGGSGAGAGYVIYGSTTPITFSKDKRTATFLDSDGDIITVKVTKGQLSLEDFELGPTGGLRLLDLSDDGQEFKGTSITISAKKPVGGTGDGKVNVGAIDASGIDLATVTVSGDLGQIDAGDAGPLTPGIARLSVGSLGDGAGTQSGGTLDPLHSEISGKLSTLVVAGAVKGIVDVTGALGPVTIGGNLDGSAPGALAGLLRTTGDLGTVTVKGSILGGADLSGLVSGGKLGRVTVTGSLTSADAAKPVFVIAKGVANPTSATASIALAALTVKGNVLNAEVLAGLDAALAQTNVAASLGPIAITGDTTASLFRATKNIGTVSVGKNFIGTVDHSGIAAGEKLGRVTIGLDLKSASVGTPVLICAPGKVGGTTAADALAIAAVTVKGNVLNAQILAGYGLVAGAPSAANGDASIGAVAITGTWTASSLVAGIADTPSDGFGQNDAAIAGGLPNLVAKIASVTIKGAATGSAGGGHFGITAGQIVTATITGVKQPLVAATKQNLSLDTTNTNFRLVEV